MSELTAADQITIRSAPEPSLALERVVLRARSAGIRYKGRRVSKEAVANAAWLFLDSLDDQSLAHILERAVRRLDAVLKGEPPPADDVVAAPGVARAGRRAKPVAGYRVRSASEREADDLKPAVPKRDRGIKRPEG